ncbi:MAG: DNA repair protein RecO [Patescibacteria group bacterium]|jgi:DNA repair protein RecO (recombination protein O)
MDETKNTPALILNRQPYRENDSLVTVYTLNFGKLSLVARGTKKLQSKLAGHLEPISLADILIIKGKSFDYIGSAIVRDAYLGLKDDLNKLYYAGRAIAWFNRLVKENQADERLFYLLVNWLKILDNYPTAEFSKANGELFLIFFSLKLMSELGYQPEMHYCLNCKQKIKPGKNYFNLQNGGVIGEECYEGPSQSLLTISDNCVKLVRFMISNRFQKAKKIKTNKKLIKELSFLINSFINFQL